MEHEELFTFGVWLAHLVNSKLFKITNLLKVHEMLHNIVGKAFFKIKKKFKKKITNYC